MSPGRSFAMELGSSVEVMLAAPLRLRGEAGAGLRPIAIGWATVELDRAARDLARRLPEAGPFERAAPDGLLGAGCLIGPRVLLPGGPPNPVRLVLLEPSTEGRLAASLARHGEGPIAVWLEADRLPAPPLSRPVEGPFGLERLLLGGAVEGPHLLVTVGRTGTIER